MRRMRCQLPTPPIPFPTTSFSFDGFQKQRSGTDLIQALSTRGHLHQTRTTPLVSPSAGPVFLVPLKKQQKDALAKDTTSP